MFFNAIFENISHNVFFPQLLFSNTVSAQLIDNMGRLLKNFYFFMLFLVVTHIKLVYNRLMIFER